ncbi:ornithine carbamoyltransferase, mitochondrial-like [Hyposmocoma kahamanoa]|uniref:ornithine carbamoyltransferase, mitochondrial-like n=1 Tax=Hyposmocoma kahamanoa TaxID=1477025 RepID=UPI000E6D7F83|nr:ornithine carbamoyltransferase, mitochondrial-like [Hyposmocoma kahamanoa]
MILFRTLKTSLPLVPAQKRCASYSFPVGVTPKHLICFKFWTSEMIMEILNSAITLKSYYPNTHRQRLNLLTKAKVTILQEVNKPFLSMAVSKAATFLGASDVHVVDNIVWDQDYAGRVFALMSDVIFVSTSTHMHVQRFAEQSTVPVLCMHSRTHSSIQSLATVMAIFEEFGTMKNMQVGYIGPPHQVLNSYLLLCPMLGANLIYKCSCDLQPITPLLYKISEDLCEKTNTKMVVTTKNAEVIRGSQVIIAGPTTKKKEKLHHFKIKYMDLEKAKNPWIFFHCCPRGPEIEDSLWNHNQARTYNAFDNFQYIAAALMTNVILGYNF